MCAVVLGFLPVFFRLGHYIPKHILARRIFSGSVTLLLRKMIIFYSNDGIAGMGVIISNYQIQPMFFGGNKGLGNATMIFTFENKSRVGVEDNIFLKIIRTYAHVPSHSSVAICRGSFTLHSTHTYMCGTNANCISLEYIYRTQSTSNWVGGKHV